MIMLSGIELALLALLGWILAWDQNTGANLQISQPLFAGALAGALSGHFEAGVAAGASVQAIWMVTQPVGGARLPDLATAGLTAAVAAPADLSLSGQAWLDDGRLAAAVVLGVVAAGLGGRLLDAQRILHGRLAAALPGHVRAGNVGAIERLHLISLGLHGLRGALAALGAGLIAPGLASWLADRGLVAPAGRIALVLAVVALAGGVGRRRRRALAAGVAAGLLLGVV